MKLAIECPFLDKNHNYPLQLGMFLFYLLHNEQTWFTTALVQIPIHGNRYIAMILQETNVAQSSQTSLLPDCHLLAWIQTLQTSDIDISSSPRDFRQNYWNAFVVMLHLGFNCLLSCRTPLCSGQVGILRLLQGLRLKSVSGCSYGCKLFRNMSLVK